MLYACFLFLRQQRHTNALHMIGLSRPTISTSIGVWTTVIPLTDPLKREAGCKPLPSYYPQRRWVPHNSTQTVEELKFDAFLKKLMSAAEALVQGKKVVTHMSELKFFDVTPGQLVVALKEQIRMEIGSTHPEDKEVTYKVWVTVTPTKEVILKARKELAA